MNAGHVFLEDAQAQFKKYKNMAERAMAQVSDEDLFREATESGNSMAIIAKHMAGNMCSRWTDFLTTDGEKETRNRDDEFEMEPNWSRKDVLAYWETGWERLFEAVNPLMPSDLARTVTIRGEDHLVLVAISRQLTHYASHVGQIILLARSFTGKDWESLSIPRGQSEEFNAQYWGSRKASRPDFQA